MVHWKINGIFKADPNKVYDEITSLGEKFTPEQIVEYARENKKSELNKCFEWSDKAAAKKYRIIQAQTIIRNIVVIKDVEEGDPDTGRVVVRAIISTNERTNEYEPIQRTVVNQNSYNRLLAAAMDELQAFKKKYDTLAELSGIIAEIEALIAS